MERRISVGPVERHQEAFDCYVRAASVRDWAPPSQTARALRGQGVQLVDLDRLDEAEDALRRSLELEPESETAHNELGVHRGRAAKTRGGKERNPVVSPLIRQSSDRSIDNPGSWRWLRICPRYRLRRLWGRRITPESPMHSWNVAGQASKKSLTALCRATARTMRKSSGTCCASLFLALRLTETWPT